MKKTKRIVALLVLAGLLVSIGVVGLVNAPSAQPQTGVQPQPNVPRSGVVLYIFGTESCGWCQKQKTESATVVDSIVFVEINDQISGTTANLEDFFQLADIVTKREYAGTPINVLAIDSKYALWIGYVPPEELTKVMEQLKAVDSSLYLTTGSTTFQTMSQEQYQLVDDVIKKH